MLIKGFSEFVAGTAFLSSTIIEKTSIPIKITIAVKKPNNFFIFNLACFLSDFYFAADSIIFFQISAGKFEPDTPFIGELSSLPSQTAAIRFSLKPTNQASR